MELISAVKDGFKNYANTKAIATRSQSVSYTHLTLPTKA